MELVTLGIFCAALVGAIFTGVPTVCALLVGLAAFCIYAWRWSGSARRVARMCWEGIAPIAKILGMLALIGVLTGLWRAAGVIPAIVCYAVPLISPGVFLLATFLLNCLVSVLTGTSFGTAATVGFICISMAGAMGVPLFAAGGAALSGAFFWRPLLAHLHQRPFGGRSYRHGFLQQPEAHGQERGGSLCADVRRVLRAGAAYPRKRRGGRYGRFAGERICRGARGSAAAGDRVRPGLDAR